jgi:nitrite reductase/ring-hydroxylating ferredoxin subunit
MDLPASIVAIGTQLEGGAPIAADPQLMSGADVFAAERQRVFLRPWVAVDHQSRTPDPGRYVKFEAAGRSILLTRDDGGRLRALRNVCIHAGYPVCEAEEGPAERLVCPYHGWEFAADGRLLEPDLSARIDPARLRLAEHPVRILDGLIFVDLSKSAATANGADDPPVTAGIVPGWIGDATVTARARFTIDWNWKLALQFVRSRPQLFCAGCGGEEIVGFGPLSFLLTRADQANLLRVNPKSAARTEIEVVRMAPDSAPTQDELDLIGEGLRGAKDDEAITPTMVLDRVFYGWYWSLMSPS